MNEAASLAHPRHWLSWLSIGALWLIGQLPFPILYGVSCVIGEGLFYLVRSRARITLINLKLCLPELSAKERRRIAKHHFRLLVCSVLSIGSIWWASKARLRRLVKIEGIEHIENAKAKGNGVILLAPHFVSLDAGGVALSMNQAVTSMYQSHKNPVFDFVSYTRRSRFGADLFDRKAPLTRLIRKIRSGLPFYYLPDQNAGAKHGVFVPFFGIQASTFPTLGKMAQAGQAVVIPFSNRLSWRGIEAKLDTPMQNFPQGDAYEDTARMNLEVEKMVRELGANYLWSHKRFKRRPDGEADLYKSTDVTSQY